MIELPRLLNLENYASVEWRIMDNSNKENKTFKRKYQAMIAVKK